MADAPADWNDPCGVADWLRPKVVALVTGGSNFLVRYGDREVRYTPGNVDAAQALLANYEARCAAKTGDKTNRRHAIRFG